MVIKLFKEFPIRKAQKEKELKKIEASAHEQTAIVRSSHKLPDNLNDLDQSSILEGLPSHVLTTDKMTEELMNHLSGYTMNEMAEMEWASIEKYIRSILPPRGATTIDSKAVVKPVKTES